MGRGKRNLSVTSIERPNGRDGIGRIASPKTVGRARAGDKKHKYIVVNCLLMFMFCFDPSFWLGKLLHFSC